MCVCVCVYRSFIKEWYVLHDTVKVLCVSECVDVLDYRFGVQGIKVRYSVACQEPDDMLWLLN